MMFYVLRDLLVHLKVLYSTVLVMIYDVLSASFLFVHSTYELEYGTNEETR